MGHNDRRLRLKALLAGSGCVVPASVFDPISARIAEHLGFELGMFAGSLASLAVLGAPDLVLITLTEFADQARRICRASDLPVFVDADHGYGNALNVMRTIDELENAGVAGLTIEDTELPTPYGAASVVRLCSLDESVGKLRAALATRQDPSLVIAARTSAPSVTGMGDALARLAAFEKTGVDAIFLSGPLKPGELEAFTSAAHIPVLLGNGGTGPLDKTRLASLGIRICLQGHLSMTASIKAIHDTMKELRGGRAPRDFDTLAPDVLVKTVTRDGDYRRAMKDCLGSE